MDTPRRPQKNKESVRLNDHLPPNKRVRLSSGHCQKHNW